LILSENIYNNFAFCRTVEREAGAKAAMRRRLDRPSSLAPAGQEHGTGTFASAAYDRLRREILTAAVAPGEKLLIRQICEEYNIGLNPVREALNRLSTEGLVRQVDRRGFSVAPLSADDLGELIWTRCALNELALREAIAQGDDTWEEKVILAAHRLTRTPRHLSPSAEVNEAWEEAHKNFHAALLSACASKWLMGFCQQLFDAAERYRHLARRVSRAKGPQSPRDPGEHQAIAAAAVARNADEAVRLLSAHFQKTADLVREDLAWGTSALAALAVARGKGVAAR
jgi:DNA-binding GntR family transcriptional regulator